MRCLCAQERGPIEGGSAGAGNGLSGSPCASWGALRSALPPQALPAPLRGQKNGGGKRPQGRGRMRKKSAHFERVWLQVAPGRLVRAVDGERAPRPRIDPTCLLQDSWARPGERLGVAHCSPFLRQPAAPCSHPWPRKPSPSSFTAIWEQGKCFWINNKGIAQRS